MVEAYLGAPIVLDGAGLGSAAHRVRLFWTNWCQPEILQAANPQDKIPQPSLQQILHVDHESPMPNKTSISPFVRHNKLGEKRICMPTIVNYPGSHAYRMQENGKPGEGQLWNKAMRRRDEPSLKEREQLMGYEPDATKTAHVTVQQRAQRLGQAMDGNTMRWLGAFLYATQSSISTDPIVSVKRKKKFKDRGHEIPLIFSHDEVHHHQACAVVEQIMNEEDQEYSDPNSQLGEGTTPWKIKIDSVDKIEKDLPQRDSMAKPAPKWKLGPKLTERDQLRVLQVLEDNNDRFAYKIEGLGRYTGPPMEIKINTKDDIFRPPHKLGEKEWAFVGEQCTKLEKMGFVRRSYQSHYASATVVVRKKDENGEYTDFRKCGDYRPINLETDLDRYQLPLIESIFNDMKGANIFSKLDLRSGYHQMPLSEADWPKPSFWGAQRLLWEWCVVPLGLKNAPSYFQRQMDKILVNLPFARCYVDDIVTWSTTLSEHLQHLSTVFERLRNTGLKVHPGKCLFATNKIDISWPLCNGGRFESSRGKGVSGQRIAAAYRHFRSSQYFRAIQLLSKVC